MLVRREGRTPQQKRRKRFSLDTYTHAQEIKIWLSNPSHTSLSPWQAKMTAGCLFAYKKSHSVTAWKRKARTTEMGREAGEESGSTSSGPIVEEVSRVGRVEMQLLLV